MDHVDKKGKSRFWKQYESSLAGKVCVRVCGNCQASHG